VENQVPREKLGKGRILLNDDQRRRLPDLDGRELCGTRLKVRARGSSKEEKARRSVRIPANTPSGTNLRESLPVNEYEFSGATAVIYSFDSTPIEVVQYEDTDHYKVLKSAAGR
jgi:hypothetical protein